MPNTTAALDLDMLATDLADVLASEDYRIDITAEDVRQLLPAFLDQLRAAAADNDDTAAEPGPDAATWSAQDNDGAPPEPTPNTGRQPRMTYLPWQRSQSVDLGSTGRHEHYWRCPACRTWAGPYDDIMAAKTVGMDHHATAHALPQQRRADARKAARKLAGPRMTATVFDELAGRVAAAYELPITTIHDIVTRIGSVVAGYSHTDDLVAAIDRSDVVTPATPTRRIVLDLAGELGHADWLIRMGA